MEQKINTIKGLLHMGSVKDPEQLFSMIVDQAPKLVGAKECSIFWINGPWRKDLRGEDDNPDLIYDAFYRRATYFEKKHLIGKESYQKGEGLTGWVAKYGKPLRIDDITNKSELLKKGGKDCKHADKGRGYKNSENKDYQKAFLGVPVSIKNEVVGVIRIAKTISPDWKFTEEHEKVLETFANYTGLIVERIEEEECRKAWEELYKTRLTMKTKNFDEYLQEVADRIPKFLSAEACSIFLIEANNKLILKATTKDGPLCDQVGNNDAYYKVGEGLTGWVAKNNQPLLLRNVDDKNEVKEKTGNSEQHVHKLEEYQNEQSNFLAAPISRGKEVVGVVRIAQDSRGRFFSNWDKESLYYFCNNLALLVENEKSINGIKEEKDDALKRVEKTRNKLKDIASDFDQNVQKMQKSLSGLLSLDGIVSDNIIRIPESGTYGLIKPLVGYKKEIEEKLAEFPFEKNVFLMMKFRESNKRLGRFIIDTLNKNGFKGIRADDNDWRITDNVYNPIAVLYCCKYGIALFDEPESNQEYSPNVAYELGIMQNQGKDCLILCDKKLKKTPFDLIKDIYRTYDEPLQVNEYIEDWIKKILKSNKGI